MKNLDRAVKESIKKYPELNESCVECKCCGFRGKDISRHVKIYHNIDSKEYKEKYPDSQVKSQILISAVSGENNPGYGHGGKLSPFSKKNIMGLDPRLAVEKAMKSKEENSSITCRVDYWIKQGYSEEEAKLKLRERQRTFTLEKCIEKYGKGEGLKIWNERQENWQKSLNSKPQYVIEDINRRKSSRINFRSLWGKELQDPGLFYIVRVKEGSYKLGITSRSSVYDRYKNIGKADVLFENKDLTISDAFKLEQLLIRKFKEYIFKGDYGDYGWTEVIHAPYESIISEYESLIQSGFKEEFNKLKAKTL